MATLKGKAVLWSVGEQTFTGGVSGTAFHQKMDLTKTADSAEVRNSVGDVAAKVYYNARNTLSVSVVPYAATSTGLTAAVTGWLPAIGATVTIDDPDNIVDATQSGKFNVTSAKLGRTVDGVGTIDLELEQWVANDITSIVSP